jgi:FKBP12-rapamycin complex-associated protein
MAPDYENLTLLQKVEVFEYALENTTGQDLYRVLWLKSANSEHWLERRATYTRSLAVNSMVGHILGLGDRHPSNLLLERATGKVVHIDFGDCFEVAMHREKFPEKVPFRLTRMLTHAMEVSPFYFCEPEQESIVSSGQWYRRKLQDYMRDYNERFTRQQRVPDGRS